MGGQEARGTSRRLSPGSCWFLASAEGQVWTQKARREHADSILLFRGHISASRSRHRIKQCIINKTLFESYAGIVTLGPPRTERRSKVRQIFCGRGKRVIPSQWTPVTALMMARSWT